jgi:hypothetical protein
MLYAGALVFLLGRSEARQAIAKPETRAQPLSEPVHDRK